MIGQTIHFRSFTSPLGWLRQRQRALAQFGVLVACLGAVGFGLEAQASHHQAESALAAPATSLAQQTSPAAPAFPAPGRYLFGQVPEPDQLGQGYMVVESTGDRVYGALYYPSSSFDCFQGQVEGNELAMTVIHSYSQEVYPYAIALESDTTVAAGQLSDGLEPVSPSGFYALETLTDNDLRMLDVCRSVVAPQ